MVKKIRSSLIYRAFLWFAIIICLLLLWQISKDTILHPFQIIQQDFTHIWSSGYLNLLGENPYDPEKMLKIKNEVSGLAVEQDIVSLLYSPPWIMPIPMVLSLLPYSLSRLIWLILNIILWIICALWIWRIYGGAEKQRWIALLLAFSFAPIIFVLMFGQTTFLVLLGIIGFVDQIENHENDWLAGIFAALITIKPQLFYLFWPALLLWVIDQRRYKIIISFGLTIFVAIIMGIIFNPYLIPQYLYMIGNYPPSAWITPTIGSYLRLLFGWDKFWLQFIPLIFGGIWFVNYWIRNRQKWYWSKEMPLLVIVSILTMIYGWTSDYVLLLIVIIPAMIALLEFKHRKLTVAMLIILILIEILYLIMHQRFNDQYFGWFGPALVLWYFLIMKLNYPSEDLLRF